ncbi:MAG TPA: PilZ domain-containing protein [Blastocatellia bacterium]|nr:PilZ domain-containing protein [Blastocatellia bacterium]
MIEQRRYTRVKVLLPLQINVEEQQVETHQAACLDLSVGGLLCQSEKKLVVGNIVGIKVQFNENDEWSVDAKVVRVERVRKLRAYRIAFEFSGPSPKLVEKLTYFLLYPRDSKSPAVEGIVRSPFEY